MELFIRWSFWYKLYRFTLQAMQDHVTSLLDRIEESDNRSQSLQMIVDKLSSTLEKSADDKLAHAQRVNQIFSMFSLNFTQHMHCIVSANSQDGLKCIFYSISVNEMSILQNYWK